MDKEHFYNEFSNYDTSYLLTLRAKGPELADNAHAAIEKIAAERGENLPPIPTQYIDLKSKNNSKKRGGIFSFFSTALTIILVLVGLVLAKVISKEIAVSFPLVGITCLLGYLGFLIYKKVNKKNLTTEKINQLNWEKTIKEKHLTELITCAADGNIIRVKELLEYGADVNERAIDGSTALMYAIRNEHADIVEYLLGKGAKTDYKTDRRMTALDFAKKCSNEDIKRLIL